MAQQKEKKPITDGDFSMLLTGTCKGAAWDPKGGFIPAAEGVRWNMLCSHPEMAEGRKSWGERIEYTDFQRLLVAMETIANTPGEDAFVREFKGNFFKDGKMNHNGISLLVGRAANGTLYMTWRCKKIPKVGFMFSSKNTKFTSCTGDGDELDPRVDSRETMLAWIYHWRTRLADWMTQDIKRDEYQGGNSDGGGNSGYKKSGGNNYNNGGGSSSSSSSSSDQDGFDEDIPF